MQPDNQAPNSSPDFLPQAPVPTAPEFLPKTIPVIEESARIDKVVVETGRVVIRKTVRTDTETVDVPIQHEQVHVERVPVNQYVDTPPAMRLEGDTTIIPVLREEVVVTTRILLVEELHVRKQTITTNNPQTVELRREEVHYERFGENAAPAGPPPSPVPNS